ncbi:trypsin-like peptidase domain-containing protein [Streptomyces sp. NPDC001678]|uniref:VMAP-C domain-containing protein n=1 Tax=Streptomyces sp. NPDC001678 TaxID=3364599 RepID=UPI0036B6EB16
MSALEGTARRAVVRISAPGGGYDASGARFWGSGFFIAPGWALTCAHVVGNGGGDVLRGATAVDVTDWQGRTAPGRVAFALPMPADPDVPPRPWRLPDLALLEVEGAEGAECLWLSDRSAVVPAPISLHGWSMDMGELGPRFGVGTATGGDGADGSAMLLRGEIPVAGCSGGPVVDTARGAVIGVCKGRGKDTAGLAVPITALRRLADDLPGRDRLHAVIRAHDRHHYARYRAVGTGAGWTGMQQALRPGPADGFTPVLRTHLFARLAELSPPATPGEVMALVETVKRRVIQEPYQPGVEHDPRSWREGVGLLYDLRDGGHGGHGGTEAGPDRDLELEAVLLYAARVAAAVSRFGAPDDTEPLRELSTWIATQAEPLPDVIRVEIHQILHGGSDDPDGPRAPSPPGTVELRKPERRDVEPGVAAPSGARADVLVQVDSLVYGDRYPWRVKLLLDGGVVNPLVGDETGVPRARLRETLREPIARALRQGDAGGHLAELHVMLPRELFDEPVDAWRLSPPGADGGGIDPHTLPLGQRRVVVVRDRRRRDEPPTPEWHQRWDGISRGPLTAVPLRREAPLKGHGGPGREGGHAAYGRLSFAADSAVPVYCGEAAAGAGATAMEAALAAGHAVVIWRRCATGHTDCAEFHRRVSLLVDEARTAGGLPQLIRSLRIACADPEAPDPEAEWARSIALLYDSPLHPPSPGEPLCAPLPRPGGAA